MPNPIVRAKRRRDPCPATGKMRWVTEMDANLVASNVLATRGVSTRIYRCTESTREGVRACGDWHLTRQLERPA